MYPEYHQGDVFVIFKSTPEKIEVGDLIVYNGLSVLPIIHRVQDVVISGGEYFYRAKGDNYNLTKLDTLSGGTLIAYEDIQGKVIHSVGPLTSRLIFSLNNEIYFVIFAILLIFLFLSVNFYFRQFRSSVHFDISIEKLVKKLSWRHLFYILGVLLLSFIIISAIVFPQNQDLGDDILVGNTSIHVSNQIYSSDFINDSHMEFTYFTIILDMRLKTIMGHYELNMTLTDLDGQLVSQMQWRSRYMTSGHIKLSLVLVINNWDLPRFDQELKLGLEISTVRLLYTTITPYEKNVTYSTP